MKFKQAMKLINKAIEEDNKDKIYQLYLVEHKHSLYLLSNGVKHDILTFNEYYEKMMISKPSVDTRSADEIMNDILGLKFE